MSVRIAQIPLFITIPFIERNLSCGHQRMAAIFENVPPFRESLLLLLANIKEVLQELPFLIIQALNHRQFPHRSQWSIAVNVFRYIVNLLFRKER